MTKKVQNLMNKIFHIPLLEVALKLYFETFKSFTQVSSLWTEQQHRRVNHSLLDKL